jgi:sterol desaturase/sphingolipid hydroxylase (fatty acid hydroxylase superfamily)
MNSNQDILSMIALGMTVVVIFEFLIMYLRRKEQRDPKETATNLAIYGVGKVWRESFVRGIELAALGALYAWTPLKVPDGVWGFLATLLAVEFVYYWKHRTEHQSRLYWAYHSVHHSSQEYNLSTAIRLPWLGYFLGSATFYAPMVLLGFNPLLIIISRQIVLLYQFWIHTDKIGSMGWFDKIFNSPSNHRVHHASNTTYLDKNHGGILIIWDRMFGTYAAERPEEPVVYGLTKNIGTANPIMINLHEPLAIVRDVRQAKSWRDAVGYVFKGPGWSPAAAVPDSSSAALQSLPQMARSM